MSNTPISVDEYLEAIKSPPTWVDCEGLDPDDPAHEGKWDTKNGNFRTCSWCGIMHPDDEWMTGR